MNLCSPFNNFVYKYPVFRISGYPDVRRPDIFKAFTRIESKHFRRLHVSRRPDAFYAAYSLCVEEIRKCFPFFFDQVACVPTLFHFPFFMLIFLGSKKRSKFCLVSSVIYIYKTVVFVCVLTPHQLCAYPGAVIRQASGPTPPPPPENRNHSSLIKSPIPRSSKSRCTRKQTTLPVKNSTYRQLFFEHVKLSKIVLF